MLYTLAHCCAIFLCYLGCDDRHQYPMSNNKDHLVGQLTICSGTCWQGCSWRWPACLTTTCQKPSRVGCSSWQGGCHIYHITVPPDFSLLRFGRKISLFKGIYHFHFSKGKYHFHFFRDYEEIDKPRARACDRCQEIHLWRKKCINDERNTFWRMKKVAKMKRMYKFKSATKIFAIKVYK